MTRVKLVIIPPDHNHKREIVIDRFPLELGRSFRADLPLGFASVSGHHLRIDSSGDGILTLTDLDSTNGTYVDTQALTPHEPTATELPVRLRLGDLLVELVRDDGDEYAEETLFTMAESSTRLREMVDEVIRQAPTTDDTRPFFEVLSGPGSGHRHFLIPDDQDVAIGTDSDADISLDLNGLPARLATVYWEGIRGWLEPTSPHIHCDQEQLIERHELRSGDRFVIDCLELLYFDPLEDALVSMDLDTKDRSSSPEIDEEPQTPQAESKPDRQEDTPPTAPAAPSEGRATTKHGSQRMGAVEIALLLMSIIVLVATMLLLVVLFI